LNKIEIEQRDTQLLDLPVEAHFSIVKLLDPISLAKWAQASRTLYSIAGHSQFQRSLLEHRLKQPLRFARETIANQIIYSVAISHNRNLIASASHQGTITLWDIESGALIRTFTGHQGGVETVAFSQDGSQLASGSWDNTIRIWDVTTGNKIKTLNGHEGEVVSVAFSSNGSEIASGSLDKTIKAWNAQSGEEVQSLSKHRSSVYSIAFSRDGLKLISGSRDKTIHLWNR
jgi:WD40 repeat protein